MNGTFITFLFIKMIYKSFCHTNKSLFFLFFLFFFSFSLGRCAFWFLRITCTIISSVKSFRAHTTLDKCFRYKKIFWIKRDGCVSSSLTTKNDCASQHWIASDLNSFAACRYGSPCNARTSHTHTHAISNARFDCVVFVFRIGGKTVFSLFYASQPIKMSIGYRYIHASRAHFPRSTIVVECRANTAHKRTSATPIRNPYLTITKRMDGWI